MRSTDGLEYLTGYCLEICKSIRNRVLGFLHVLCSILGFPQSCVINPLWRFTSLDLITRMAISLVSFPLGLDVLLSKIQCHQLKSIIGSQVVVMNDAVASFGACLARI